MTTMTSEDEREREKKEQTKKDKFRGRINRESSSSTSNMDLKECIRILAERQVSNRDDPSCPCCKLPEFCPPVDNSAADNRGDVLQDSELAEVPVLSLIDALLHVQESRVKVCC